MYALIKKVLFLWPAEEAHHLTMRLLKTITKLPAGKQILRKRFCYARPSLEKELWGITFPNPVGLAAGFDKDARYTDILECLGFGFIEIGTVTPKSQPGNDKPRLFRLPEDQALINRMGFNNEGAQAAAERLKKRKGKVIIGGNIGKNKTTPNEKAIEDYEKAFWALKSVVDYFVVNVSSPNTPGLRSLQEKDPLQELLTLLQKLNNAQSKPKPLLLKIAPDLTNKQLDDIVDIVQKTQISGLIATNTTISRSGLTTDADEVKAFGSGGLSGSPLKERSTEVIHYLHKKTKGAIPIIASGGIFTAEDAKEKLKAGASLVQVYTGFIYEGPGIVKKICKGLEKGLFK